MAAKKRTTAPGAAAPKVKKVVKKKAATTKKAAKPKVAKAATAKKTVKKAATAKKAVKVKKAAPKLNEAQIDLLKKVHALQEYIAADSKETPKLKALVTKKLLKTKADKATKKTKFILTVAAAKLLAKAAAL